MEDKKIFDDFPEANCNQCEPYWTNQCDGASKGSERVCTGFKPVRSVKIPEEIKSLRNNLKWVYRCLILQGLWIIIHILTHFFGG